MGKNIRSLTAPIVFSSVVLLGLFGPQLALAKVKSGPAVVPVVLFNYSNASPGVLTRAKQKVDELFSRSGIRFAWTDCPPSPGSVGSELCQSRPAPGEIGVRILEQHFGLTSAFGLAIHPVWATVYYEPTLRLAETATGSEYNFGEILGCLIAHEIGHLLLGPNHHTVSGIMRDEWDIRQVQLATMDALGFTTEQAKLMRANARMRATPEEASVMEQPLRAPTELSAPSSPTLPPVSP